MSPFYLTPTETIPSKFQMRIKPLDIVEEDPTSTEKSAMAWALYKQFTLTYKLKEHLPIISVHYHITEFDYGKRTTQFEHSTNLVEWIKQGESYYYYFNKSKYLETPEWVTETPINHTPITIEVEILKMLEYVGLGTIKIV